MDDISKILLCGLLLVVLVLISRLFWLWYWRVGEIVLVLRDISTSLRIARGEPALGTPTPWYDEAGALHNGISRPIGPSFKTKAEYEAWKASKA